MRRAVGSNAMTDVLFLIPQAHLDKIAPWTSPACRRLACEAQRVADRPRAAATSKPPGHPTVGAVVPNGRIDAKPALPVRGMTDGLRVEVRSLIWLGS